MATGAWRVLNQTTSSRYYRFKNLCKRQGVSFDLPIERYKLLITDACWFCHARPEVYSGSGVTRLDKTCGYDVRNTVSCCKLCNMKNNVGRPKGKQSRMKIIKKLLKELFTIK